MFPCSPPSPAMTSTPHRSGVFRWALRLVCLCAAFAAAGCASISQPTRPISALPVTIVEATGPGDAFALWYSGDAGWGTTDRAIAGRLAARGVPVVGVSSRRYFWHQRTVEAAAADLDALAARYAATFDRPGLILVGYSFGGAMLPMIVPRLSPATRARLRLVALIAPSRHGQLIVRPWTWLEIPSRGAVPTVRTAAALSIAPSICIYGARDSLAACPLISSIPSVRLDSGHLFKGRADTVAEAIARAAGLGPAPD